MHQYYYHEITQNIKIEVEPKFLPEFSKPDEKQFVWAYTVRITNLGHEPVQLLSRYWYITDGNGNVHEVKGAGVVGEQPVIKSGEHFIYTSSCPLNTNSGMMMGKYYMLNHETHLEFIVNIPPFSLHIAGQNTLN